MKEAYENFLSFFRSLHSGEKGKVKGCQKNLAIKLKISPQHLNDILGGRKKASQNLQEAIAAHYGMPLHEFLAFGKQCEPHQDKEAQAEYGPPINEKEERIQGLLRLAREILEEDGLQYASALASNILSFHGAIETAKDLKKLKREVAAFKKQLAMKKNPGVLSEKKAG